MLKFGVVTNINPLMAKARVEFADDDMKSYWLPVIQKKTNKDSRIGQVPTIIIVRHHPTLGPSKQTQAMYYRLIIW